MVARLDGPTADIARGLVDKAIQAETDGLWGRTYFDLRGITNADYKLGDDWIRGASEICRRLGFETVVDESPGTFPVSFPLSQVAFYAGWYDENVSGPFTRPTVEFMPGAIAYHLHSFSAGTIRSTTRNWVGPLLAKGATATMGCVNEPYLTGTPDVATFFARILFFGFSFGEAAYAAQGQLSWQTTVIGDPLYRPFGKSPRELHAGLATRHSKLIEWSHLRAVDLSLVRGAAVAGAIGYLNQIEATKQSAVLNEKLGDLYAMQGKPSSTVFAYQKALKLGPSLQQRIRLRLMLGEKLAALNRDEDAYHNYQKFLEESPDYPDKLSIYRKLLPLAQKLGKKDDAEKYQRQIN
jgi:tetratricopeptide (TPR) repeat protein